MKKQHIKAVIFDLDGTLLNSIDGIVESFLHVFELHLPGHRISRKNIIEHIGRPLTTMMVDFSNDPSLAETMVRDFREYNNRIIDGYELYPGVLQTLDRLLKAGYPLGIVTSKARASAMSSIERLDLARRMSLILTSEDCTTHKPDPGPLLEAAKRLDMDPRHLVYLGDSTHDITCAKAAGSLAIAALWGPYERTALEKSGPDYLIEDISELPDLILTDSACSTSRARA